TLLCYDGRQVVTYDADEFGFNNPPGRWMTARNGTLLLIGDSFVHGFCVPRDKTIAEQMPKDLRDRMLNLGQSASGPLTELATLREHLSYVRPSYVFWFYFEGNDLDDPTEELRHPLLRGYLDPEFSQNLSELRRPLVEAMISYVDIRERELQATLDHPGLKHVLAEIRGFLSFTAVRNHVRVLRAR